MVELIFVEVVNVVLYVEFECDDDVMVFGEDVGCVGGVFCVMVGLFDWFGVLCCVDILFVEVGIFGMVVGFCMVGWCFVCEM